MSAPPPPPRGGGGMSLYANLLNPKADSAASTISSAPVLYDNGDKDDAANRDINPALRFQPIRRPQAAQKKPSKPATFPKPMPAQGTTNSGNDTSAKAAAPPPAPTRTSTPPAAPQRSTLADWAAAGADDEFLAVAAAEKRQRGGRKAAKKRNKRQTEQYQRETDWDEIYDPARPTNVDEYLRSEERVREVQDWKAVLYAHRRRRGSEERSEESEETAAGGGNQFAPPASYVFAPPPASPPPASASVPDDATGDDAYARRLALSGMGAPPPPPVASHTPSPPPPPPSQNTATISRAPVRYEAPPQPAGSMDIDTDGEDTNASRPSLGLGASSTADDDNDQPRKNLPGQKGFAQRLMSKYGWTAGSGLGAESSGIINPLSVQVSKRRKKPDAEGGGFAEPGSRGKIIGGKLPSTASADTQVGKFGPMSEVIVLRNMLEGMDSLEEEIESGLGQEIGEECGDKYGRVERLYIDVTGRQVFIKFTDAVSALRAVNALEGRVFNGNALAARFWDTERFEKGQYV